MNIIEALNWRYAAKSMNGAPVDQEKVDTILEAARLAPTGIGLQPFEIISISNKALKERIFNEASQQQPVIGSSHLLVFAAWDLYSTERINEFFDRNNKERNLPYETTEGVRNFVHSHFSALSPDENLHHAARQANIALGLAVAAAALQQVDATPMEGFNKDVLDEILGLRERGLRSTMLLAVGYRDTANDWSAGLKKIRKPKSAFVTELA